MKALLPLFLFLSLFATARADLAEVKKLMDEPVVFKTPNEVVVDNSTPLWKQTWADGDSRRTLKVSPRLLLAWIGRSQGITAKDAKEAQLIAKENAAVLKRLIPVLKSANLTSAASDLEEALKSVETSKTLERAAQDRFARLARVAQ